MTTLGYPPFAEERAQLLHGREVSVGRLSAWFAWFAGTIYFLGLGSRLRSSNQRIAFSDGLFDCERRLGCAL